MINTMFYVWLLFYMNNINEHSIIFLNKFVKVLVKDESKSKNLLFSAIFLPSTINVISYPSNPRNLVANSRLISYRLTRYRNFLIRSSLVSFKELKPVWLEYDGGGVVSGFCCGYIIIYWLFLRDEKGLYDIFFILPYYWLPLCNVRDEFFFL